MRSEWYMNFASNKLLRGLVAMAGGLALLLHTLGIIEKGINLFLILLSIGIIVYGFMISGLYKYTRKVIKQNGKSKPLEKIIHKKTKKKTTKKKKR